VCLTQQKKEIKRGLLANPPFDNKTRQFQFGLRNWRVLGSIENAPNNYNEIQLNFDLTLTKTLLQVPNIELILSIEINVGVDLLLNVDVIDNLIA
jgi:hypothetical protein